MTNNELIEALENKLEELEDQRRDLDYDIGGVQRVIDMLKGDDVVQQSYVQSDSDPNISYVVTRFKDGTKTCDCKGFEYRNDCKHIHR